MTENIEESQREALSSLILRRSAEIEERWLQTVLKDVAGLEVPLTDLRDAMADYIAKLAEGMRDGTHGELAERGKHAWVDLVREHAVTRVRLGFDISQLVHEFIVLRRTLSDVVREEGLLGGPEAQILAELIEAGIGESVSAYVDSRDFSARQSEACHLGFITHELRNPLATATLAGAQLRGLAGEHPRMIRAVNLLDRAHDSIRVLIERVLNAERLEAGEVIPVTKELELGALLDPMLETLREMANTRSISLLADYDPTIRLNVDPMLTSSAIGNLIENAIKYSSPGDVRLDVEERSSEIEVHVRDNCDGLSVEELRVIFEPFRRGRHGGKGAGLGLAIARRAVEAQGGSIHVESKGRGCHFALVLPKSRN